MGVGKPASEASCLSEVPSCWASEGVSVGPDRTKPIDSNAFEMESNQSRKHFKYSAMAAEG